MKKQFVPTPSQSEFLATAVFLISNLNANMFTNVLEIGRLLWEAQLKLSNEHGAGTYWSRWVVEKLKMQLSTGQLYRNTFLHYSPQSESRIGDYETEYLTKIGTSNLSLFYTLWSNFNKGKHGGVLKSISLEPTITLTYTDLGGALETQDLVDMSGSQLRRLIRSQSPTTSGSQKAVQINCVADVMRLDLERTRDVETLRAAIKVLLMALPATPPDAISTPEVPTGSAEVDPKTSAETANKAA